MGLKNLHPYARYKLKVYHKETSLSSVLKRYETDIIFIDFCCIFFLLLQNGPGTDIIRQSLKDNREYDHPDLARAINQFISRVLKRIKRMRGGKNDLDVCLVIDGPSIPAKKKTCEERKSRQSNSLKNNFSWKIKKAIQQNLESRADFIPYREYLKPTAITTVTKNKKQQKRQDDSNDKKKGITYFHFAAYEADAEIVYLCNQLTKNEHGAIMSNDGDLFAYPGAFNALRIIQIDWNSSSIPVTITTKSELFRKLGFPTSKKLRLLGETKMAVLASLCGNDYAPIPIATFNDIVQVIRQINCPGNSNDISADKFLQLVYEELIRNKDINISNNFDPQRFSIALHQFCIPLISGVTFDKFRCCHYPGLHINIDKNIIKQLDTGSP
ncbi:hypothetical protein INT45_000270 [Circinella minor]|uniref:Uncharacterized protein n=1 Tax=Circinella minor TaxID=1195481 RepID=A0A8H7VIL6_9FUNG|nr:hypothetical protein INT45_000270 [Circinella minor]